MHRVVHVELTGRCNDLLTLDDMFQLDLYETDGYGIVDLIEHVSLSRKAELVLGVFNLTDKTYWEWSDVRGLPKDDPNADLYARPGINGSVSFKYSFGGRRN